MHAVPSQVETVTVYRQGARVTRLAEISQPPQGWPSQLRLTDLPLTLLDNTLEARLEFPRGGGGLVARQLRVELESTHPSEPIRPLSKPHLRHRIEKLAYQLERLDDDISRMRKLEPGTLVLRAHQAPPTFPLQARRAVVDLRRRTLAEWLPRRQQLQQQLEELNHQLRQGPPPTLQPQDLRKSVVLQLHQRPDAQAPHLRLLLSYQVEGACWVPGYSIRFDRDYSLAELELRALICQSSGEDWDNVRVSVSTAETDRWTELPVLASRRLGRRQSPRTPGWRPLPPNAEELLADYDGIHPRPRGACGLDYGEPPPYLSDAQIAAVALMSLPTQLCADLFQEMGPEWVRSVTLEISTLPAVAGAEREAARRCVSGTEDLEQLAQERPELVLARLETLLTSYRPASQMRPSQRFLAAVASSRSHDLADLLCDRSGGAVASPDPTPAPPRPGRLQTGELSPEQMAFDLLYLPGAEEGDRGRLRSQTPVEASLRRWPDRQSAHLARQALTSARTAGLRALQQKLPIGYRAAEPIHSQDWLYQGEARVHLAADGEYHSVPLLRRGLPAALHWMVVPKVSCDVFRRVELDCPEDLSLPAGPADLFVGSDYLTCVELGPVAAGESFLLDMGVESAIRVVRRPTFQEQSAGLWGGSLQLLHQVHIEAHNYLGRPVHLQVREPLPQVQDGSECKVRLHSAWQPLEQGGHYHWLALAAGQRRSCQFQYTVEMSQRLELVGGNRREN
ncbi:MAG: DUF4139 domain-containing protein [Candidatus Eremiobacteraeota bacterium]|nr:DUF4139 domain-containing protein [Candidatus Eremiobacteraeota bacterium]